MTRSRLTDETVWLFMSEGCNAAEIAAYGGIKELAAKAWMLHAARKFSREVA